MTRFALGAIVATPGALDKATAVGINLADLLRKHAGGDWGLVDPEDWVLNDNALREGTRVVSAYPLPDGTRIWVITEADRSVTTALLPEEY